VRGDDPAVVRRQYADETGLRTRAAAFGGSLGGRDARDVAFAAVAERSPRRVVEVGCGWGEFAERVVRELQAEVVAVDISPRMVALARARGVDARLGDVQRLRFGEGEFDCAVANWMLYHVRDVDGALAELARVLRRGGRLVAATNGLRHLGELWTLVGRDRRREPVRFFAETAEPLLRRYFGRVERRDVEGVVRFSDWQAVRRYVASSVAHAHLAERVRPFAGPLEATRAASIFVAETCSARPS
jgi:ubiquinone/menaquinone biosynthesis C-methylase UbiE